MVEHGLYMVISWSTMFLKHGRPCLKHGQPCFDRVHFTGVMHYFYKVHPLDNIIHFCVIFEVYG